LYKPKDTYFYKAKQEGYPARSVYKLEEIDKKYRLIKRGSKILELGASPGSWLKYCLNKIGEKGYIVAIDLEEPSPRTFCQEVSLLSKKGRGSLILPPQVDFIKGDIFKISTASLRCPHPEYIAGPSKFDLLLSDLAPKTSGIKEVDQARSMELAERAIDAGKEVLKKGGDILVKLFESSEVQDLRKQLSTFFSKVTLERPGAVRKGSSEIYILGLGFRREA